MTYPVVSAVMAVRDGAEFLQESVDSILRQSFGDFEFIVIDDGSTDATAEILRRYTRLDGRVQVYQQANQGAAAAFNHGLRLAHGKYIAHMDADDVADPNRLARQVELLEKWSHVAVVGGAFEYMSRDGARRLFMPLPETDAEIKRVLPNANCLAHSTVTLRAAALAETGGYRPAFLHAEDYDLWLRIAEHHAFANLPEPLVRYRLHGRQISVRHLYQQTVSAVAARVAARARTERGVDPFARIERVTEKLLYREGVTPAQLRSAVKENAEALVRVSSQVGEKELSDRLLAHRFRSAAYWRSAIMQLACGDIKHGLKSLARAVLRNVAQS